MARGAPCAHLRVRSEAAGGSAQAGWLARGAARPQRRTAHGQHITSALLVDEEQLVVLLAGGVRAAQESPRVRDQAILPRAPACALSEVGATPTQNAWQTPYLGGSRIELTPGAFVALGHGAAHLFRRGAPSGLRDPRDWSARASWQKLHLTPAQ